MATVDSGVVNWNPNVHSMDDVRRALTAIKLQLTQGPIVVNHVYLQDEQEQYWKLIVDSSSVPGSLDTEGPYTGV